MKQRAGRNLIEGQILAVEDLNMEGVTGKSYTKSGTIPKSYWVYRNGTKVTITKEEYENIQAAKAKK